MTVLNNLLQIAIYSAVLYAAVMLFKFFFKKHASPLLLYLVWFLLIARLLIPITPDPGFSFITLPAERAQQSDGYSYASPNITDTVLPADQYTAVSPETETSNSIDTGEQAPASIPAAPVKPAFDTVQFLLLVWITGAAFFLLRFFIESALLKKRLLRESAPPPANVSDLANSIQSELNLRKNFKIKVLDGISSPALSVNFHPVAMLPKQLLSCGDSQIEYALRHELMHLKRADHLVCILLSILRAVYWFHPVVWLASRQMTLDMETACDCMVVKKMSPDQKKSYAKTILNMYACETQGGLLLGMGLENTRKTAERRIRGIFTRTRSGIQTKIWVTLLAVVLLVACFTTACQPVRESPAPAPAVSGSVQTEQSAAPDTKNAAASSTSVVVTAYLPHEWKQTMQSGGLTINVDTPVSMPRAEAFPVLRIEQAGFTQDRMNQLVRYFAENRFTTEQEKSRLEYILRQAYNQNYLSMGFNDENNNYSVEAQNFGDDFYPYTHFIYQSGSDYRTETYYNQNKESILESEELPGIRTVDYEKCLSEIKITKEDAQAQAQKVIDDLQIKDMQLVDAQKAVLFTFKEEYNSMDSNLPDRGGYSFEYTRSAGGIPGYNLTDDAQPDTQGEYCPAYPLENIEIVVTEYGVEFFNWRGYCNVVSTEEETTPLLPFEQIQQNLIKQIDYKRSMLLDDKTIKVNSIDVTSAQLRMAYIQAEDDFFQALMVPVWVFDTQENFTMSNGKEMTNYLPYMFDARNGKEINLAWIAGGSGAQR